MCLIGFHNVVISGLYNGCSQNLKRVHMRILLPIDGSQYSKRAVEFLMNAEQLKIHTNTVVLLNVQKKLPAPVEHKLKDGFIEDVYNSEVKAILKPAKKKLEQAGFKVKTKIAFGRATENIVNTAKEIKASLIIMGSHGRTPVKGVLFGSKTASVLAQTRCPMLVIREGTSLGSGRHKIGICLDGSSYGDAAVKYVEDNIHLFGTDPVIYLINVITPYSGLIIPQISSFGAPSMTKEDFEDAQKVPMEPIYEKLRDKDIETKVILLKGDPAAEIAKYATENELTILVLGTHGRGAFQALMLGSTAMRVSASCDMPLLLVHRPKKDKISEAVKENETVDNVPTEETPTSEDKGIKEN